jgi:hypothetical protein
VRKVHARGADGFCEENAKRKFVSICDVRLTRALSAHKLIAKSSFDRHVG